MLPLWVFQVFSYFSSPYPLLLDSRRKKFYMSANVKVKARHAPGRWCQDWCSCIRYWRSAIFGSCEHWEEGSFGHASILNLSCRQWKYYAALDSSHDLIVNVYPGVDWKPLSNKCNISSHSSGNCLRSKWVLKPKSKLDRWDVRLEKHSPDVVILSLACSMNETPTMALKSYMWPMLFGAQF